jgi:N-acetylmuramic acid 6-phosphate etherase
MLAGLELLVIDLQDIGVRYYTYVSTMVQCLAAAAGAGIPVLVLDRPNPLGGVEIEGPGLGPGYRSFVAALDVPVRHGLTMGELSLVAARSLALAPASVEVLAMTGWNREMEWDDTGLTWYPPSPAARSLNMINLYPATCLIEGTNVSEGRGTDAPFEMIGAPWLDGGTLAATINKARRREADTCFWPSATPISFVPQSGKYAGQACSGVRLDARGAGKGRVAFGVALLSMLMHTGHGHFEWRLAGGAEGQGERPWLDVLTGGPETRLAIERGLSWRDIARAWYPAENAHREDCSAVLMYRAGERPRGTMQLDLMSPPELARLLVVPACDDVATAVKPAVTQISRATELAAARLASGGRLIYVGAGTSGRLGVLDASECQPTFGVAPGKVIALLAGGPEAMTRSREGAEDDEASAVKDLDRVGCSAGDVVVGVAASGTTPYTLAALREAGQRGSLRIALVCRQGSPMGAEADVAIEIVTGEEPLRGSTRLKAGTAQKIVLNALSTGVFAQLGLVYGDRMVGVQVSNNKLRRRAQALVAEITGAGAELAADALRRSADIDERLAVRLAILSLMLDRSPGDVLGLLTAAGESLRRALETHRSASLEASGGIVHP